MNTGNSLLAFIAGAMAGAAVALLIAPESGEKTRKRIKDKAVGVADAAKEKILDGLEDIETVLEEK